MFLLIALNIILIDIIINPQGAFGRFTLLLSHQMYLDWLGSAGVALVYTLMLRNLYMYNTTKLRDSCYHFPYNSFSTNMPKCLNQNQQTLPPSHPALLKYTVINASES